MGNLRIRRISRPVDDWKGTVLGFLHVGVEIETPSPQSGLSLPIIGVFKGIIHQIGSKDGDRTCRLGSCSVPEFWGEHRPAAQRVGQWTEIESSELCDRVRAVGELVSSRQYSLFDHDCDRAASALLGIRGLRYHGQAWRPLLLIFIAMGLVMVWLFPGWTAFGL